MEKNGKATWATLVLLLAPLGVGVYLGHQWGYKRGFDAGVNSVVQARHLTADDLAGILRVGEHWYVEWTDTSDLNVGSSLFGGLWCKNPSVTKDEKSISCENNLFTSPPNTVAPVATPDSGGSVRSPVPVLGYDVEGNPIFKGEKPIAWSKKGDPIYPPLSAHLPSPMAWTKGGYGVYKMSAANCDKDGCRLVVAGSKYVVGWISQADIERAFSLSTGARIINFKDLPK